MKPILFNTDMVRAILEGRKTVTRRVVKPQPKSKYKYKLGYVIDSTDKKDEGRYAFGTNEYGGRMKSVKPPYKVNDVLYVRETWHKYIKRVGEGESCHLEERYGYKASIANSEDANEKWKPSIHMPKAAARIFLRVTDVRVERLQDITEEQAKAEGVIRLYDNDTEEEYTDWTKRVGLYPKSKSEWGYLNYLWHGNFGKYGSGNSKSDKWDYQYSAYDTAVGSFSSLWQSTINKDQLKSYGWEANPYVWVIEFERIDKPEEV